MQSQINYPDTSKDPSGKHADATTSTSLIHPLPHLRLFVWCIYARHPGSFHVLTATSRARARLALLQSSLPFVGRDFTGISGVSEYFDILAEYLSYSDMSFEDEDDWVVDAQNLTICLRGRARFTFRSTGDSWLETFLWRIALSEDLTGESEPDVGQGLKVQEYRVWSDTGAALLASRGELQGPEKGRTAAGENVRKYVPASARGDGVLGSDYPVKDKLGSGLSFGEVLDEEKDLILVGPIMIL